MDKRQHFPDFLQPVTGFESFIAATSATVTLFKNPPHKELHIEVAEAANSCSQIPLQPSLEDVNRQTKNILLTRGDLEYSHLQKTALARLAGIMIQFTDYVPQPNPINYPYENIEKLHNEVNDRARQAEPLTFSEQLEVSLDQSSGDLGDALWRLFIASRMYARWLDGDAFEGLPSLTTEEKIEKMKIWHDSVAACKERDPGMSQDSSGDSYYCWTHALAKFAFNSLPERRDIFTRLASVAFHNGTDIMHTLVHKTANSQSLKSNHSNAAQYGNGIGSACVDVIQLQPHALSFNG